ncbi:trehalose-phosphatase [Pseudorhodoferax sp.]|uniref:trehalose-phosphatase n=1 Tax=Pseudorhodoferax sp. TaxID=1993553 RepID=UPI002DD6A5D7|nr:trehalose-phosphatase [Pseudorhodoferax sp.]
MTQASDFSFTPVLDAAASALFLDFDGTLVELAPEPDAIVIPPDLVPLLAALRERLGGALAVVSGRAVGAIDTFLHPLDLPVAGVHGSERRAADGNLVLLPTPSLDTVEQAAARLLHEHPALAVEPKRGAVALHYRQAPQLEDICRRTMEAAVAASPGVSLLHGKMVFEAKSSLANKGKALDAFLQEPPFAGRKPVFLGDDTTDEPGFQVAQKLGGTGIKVGQGETLARHRIAGPAAVRAGLKDWLAR